MTSSICRTLDCAGSRCGAQSRKSDDLQALLWFDPWRLISRPAVGSGSSTKQPAETTIEAFCKLDSVLGDEPQSLEGSDVGPAQHGLGLQCPPRIAPRTAANHKCRYGAVLHSTDNEPPSRLVPGAGVRRAAASRSGPHMARMSQTTKAPSRGRNAALARASVVCQSLDTCVRRRTPARPLTTLTSSGGELAVERAARYHPVLVS